ncbi:MAG: peptidylprolyl isomerase [Elusimicrobia bacterium]|nr:peptidylprolyl isomerase [Elusimicrobiota bacterium]
MKTILLFIFSTLFLASCSKQGDKVVARVGSEKLTESYVNEKLMEISPNAQQYLATKPGRKQFLDILIHEKLLELAARKSPVADSAEYKARVKQMELEMRAKLGEYKDFTLTKMWVESLRSDKLKVTDDEAEAYYQKYPYKIVVDHIILDNSEEAEKTMKRLKAGADFTRTAKEYSMDKENIRLPPVMYGEFIPELEDMAFTMRVGEVQGVVKTSLGYHILKKISQDKAGGSEAKERIKRILEKKKFDAYLNEFQSKIKVEVLDENYK